MRRVTSSQIVLVGTCVLVCGSVLFADMMRCGLPGWSADGHHTIKRVQIMRMGIATSAEGATLDITNQTAVLEFAKYFSDYDASDDVEHRDELVNPLFQFRITQGKEETTLYLTVGRGVTYQGGRTNGQRSATVTLWHKLPDGKFEKYCSRNYAPLEETADPEVVAVIKKLFKKDG